MSSNSSKTFFTSDTHFFHNNIIGFYKRPFGSVEHMNEELLKNWNNVVDKWRQWDVGVDANNYTPLLEKDAFNRAINGTKTTDFY